MIQESQEGIKNSVANKSSIFLLLVYLIRAYQALGVISPLNYISFSFLYVRGGNVAYNILHATAVSIVSLCIKS